MIELNSVFVVLMIEALTVIILVVLVFLFFFRKKNFAEELAAHELIDKLQDVENIKLRQLSDIITENCDIDSGGLERLLSEISDSERILYQKIIQMFLNRDVELLTGIDEYINNISEPFCKIISYSTHETDSTELAIAEDKITGLMEKSDRLGEQLSVAMTTMDEISAEYTRVFSGTQTELELQNSSKKMFSIFKDAEQQIKSSYCDDRTEIL